MFLVIFEKNLSASAVIRAEMVLLFDESSARLWAQMLLHPSSYCDKVKLKIFFFTLSIGTHYLLTILVLKFEKVHSTTARYLKYCCMYSKQCRP